MVYLDSTGFGCCFLLAEQTTTNELQTISKTSTEMYLVLTKVFKSQLLTYKVLKECTFMKPFMGKCVLSVAACSLKSKTNVHTAWKGKVVVRQRVRGSMLHLLSAAGFKRCCDVWRSSEQSFSRSRITCRLKRLSHETDSSLMNFYSWCALTVSKSDNSGQICVKSRNLMELLCKK